MKFDSLLLLVSLMVSPIIGGFANVATPFTEAPSQPEHVVITGLDAGIDDFPAHAVFEEGDLIDGRREGLWQRYHANGAVRSEIHYHNDTPFGDYKVYSEGGLLTEEGRWEQGVNVGHLRRFWPNGTIQQMLTFDKMGVAQGQQRYFHDNGQLEMLVDLRDGQEEGDLVRLDREGRVLSRTTYRSGRIVQRAQ